MSTRDKPSFLRMCRSHPIRTCLFTVGPFAFVLAQLINATIHGAGVWFVAAIAVLMGVFSVLATRYHLSIFRRRKLADEWAQ